MTTKLERTLALAMMAGLATTLGAGCGATQLAERTRTADVRLSIPMRTDGPRLVVAGPARLLHVDIQGRGLVSLYAVNVQSGLDSDCDATPLQAAMTLVPDESNQLNLDVPDGQVICMTNISRDGKRQGEVHLHARRPIADQPAGVLQALND